MTARTFGNVPALPAPLTVSDELLVEAFGVFDTDRLLDADERDIAYANPSALRNGIPRHAN